MPARAFALLLLLSLTSQLALAQIIHGEALDMNNKKPIEGVVIDNIYTNVSITTVADGSFVIAATAGQLLEFKKPGYKLTRVRIPHGDIPPYFRIILERGITPPSDIYAQGNRYDNRRDSMRFYELYKHELDFPKMSAMEKIRSPFSAMSKRNRQIWEFQEDYSNNEKEKYVDQTFNRALITKITGLQGDSLTTYMRRYRPTYDQIRGMNDYAFYSYIKTGVRRFRSITTPRGAQ